MQYTETVSGDSIIIFCFTDSQEKRFESLIIIIIIIITIIKIAAIVIMIMMIMIIIIIISLDFNVRDSLNKPLRYRYKTLSYTKNVCMSCV